MKRDTDYFAGLPEEELLETLRISSDASEAFLAGRGQASGAPTRSLRRVEPKMDYGCLRTFQRITRNP